MTISQRFFIFFSIFKFSQRIPTITSSIDAMSVERAKLKSDDSVHISIDEFGILPLTQLTSKGAMKNAIQFIEEKDVCSIRVKQYFGEEKVFFRQRAVRKVEFDELYFDLIFVAVFHRMGHMMAHVHRMSDLGNFWIVFYFVWYLN
jgi:hypothetical protein